MQTGDTEKFYRELTRRTEVKTDRQKRALLARLQGPIHGVSEILCILYFQLGSKASSLDGSQPR